MKIKHFKAKDMRTALKMVTQDFGSNAVILSSETRHDGVEVVAAIDYETDVLLDEKVAEQDTKKSAVSDKYSHAAISGAQGLRTEIGALRILIEKHFEETRLKGLTQRDPLEICLLEWIHKMGFDKRLAEHWIANIPVKMPYPEAKERLIQTMAIAIPVVSGDLIDQGGILALVGPTGVGKTTTLAKIAARFAVRHGSENLGLITTDTYRIAAYEQLKTYGKILDVPVYIAEDDKALKKRLAYLKEKKCILIDTAGLSQRDTRLRLQSQLFQVTSYPIRTALVLSATSQELQLAETLKKYAIFNPEFAIMTKLDEATGLSDILTALIRQHLPIAYTSSGQRVPEDLQTGHGISILNQCIAYAKEYRDPHLINDPLVGVADVY